MNPNLEEAQKRTNEIGCALAVHCSDATQEAMMKGANNQPEALYIALTGILGIGEVASVMVGNPWGTGKSVNIGEPKMNKAITQQAMTFAMLLAAACVHVTPAQGEEKPDVGINYGPDKLVWAHETYEKLFGEKIDPYLDPRMAKAIAQIKENADSPLNQLLASRGKHLN